MKNILNKPPFTANCRSCNYIVYEDYIISYLKFDFSKDYNSRFVSHRGSLIL